MYTDITVEFQCLLFITLKFMYFFVTFQQIKYARGDDKFRSRQVNACHGGVVGGA